MRTMSAQPQSQPNFRIEMGRTDIFAPPSVWGVVSRTLCPHRHKRSSCPFKLVCWKSLGIYYVVHKDVHKQKVVLMDDHISGACTRGIFLRITHKLVGCPQAIKIILLSLSLSLSHSHTCTFNIYGVSPYCKVKLIHYSHFNNSCGSYFMAKVHLIHR